MSNMRRTKRLVALAAGMSLVSLPPPAATTTTTTAARPTPPARPGPSPEHRAGHDRSRRPERRDDHRRHRAETTTRGTGGTAPTGETAMTMTFDINPDAVWDDGSPITWEDFECTWQAYLNTPGSVETTGYDKITSVAAGESDKQVVVSFNEVYAPVQDPVRARPLIKKAAVADCDDISADLGTELPFSGRPYRIDSLEREPVDPRPQRELLGRRPAVVDQVVMVPLEDQETEIASLLSGEVDFIYPQFTDTLAAALDGQPTSSQASWPVPTTRDSTSSRSRVRSPTTISARRSRCRSTGMPLFQQIYGPIYDAAGATRDRGELLNCGPIVPGPYCFDSFAENTYDPEGAERF